MKRTLFMVLLSVLLLLSPLLSGALEIEITGGYSNWAFAPDKTEPFDENFKEFDPKNEIIDEIDYFLGSLKVKGDIAGNFGIDVRLERDIILQNTLSGKATMDLDFFYMDIGGFGAMLANSNKEFTGGITGGIRLSYPGIMFLSANGLTSFDSETFKNNSLIAGEAGLGFWIPNFLTVFSVSQRVYNKDLEYNYYGVKEDNLPFLISDEYIRFRLSTDIHGKKTLSSLLLSFNYDIFRRTFYGMSQNMIDVEYPNGISEFKNSIKKAKTVEELRAFVAGAELKWQMSKSFCFLLGFEVPVFTWGKQSIKGLPGNKFEMHDIRLGNLFFYKFNTGFKLNFY